MHRIILTCAYSRWSSTSIYLSSYLKKTRNFKWNTTFSVLDRFRFFLRGSNSNNKISNGFASILVVFVLLFLLLLPTSHLLFFFLIHWFCFKILFSNFSAVVCAKNIFNFVLLSFLQLLLLLFCLMAYDIFFSCKLRMRKFCFSPVREEVLSHLTQNIAVDNENNNKIWNQQILWLYKDMPMGTKNKR